MQIQQLTKRQYHIYTYIRSHGPVSNNEIRDFLVNLYEDVSRATIVRDIDALLDVNYIKRLGQGRSVQYSDYNSNLLLKYFEPSEYFKIEVDNRVIRERLNFAIFNSFGLKLNYLFKLFN